MREQGAGGGAGDRAGAGVGGRAAGLQNGWDDSAITLFHGTLRAHAQAIAGAGVELSFGRARTDFGRGFYTTTSRRQAEGWAAERACRAGNKAAGLLRVTVKREALRALATIAFVRAALNAVEYWRFVAHCREGLGHVPETGAYYDMAYGPVARVWPGNSRAAAGSDQVSFHTRRAQELLNDRAMCRMEVV